MNLRSGGWAALASLCLSQSASGQLAGTWDGVLRMAGIELEVIIRFEEVDSRIEGFLDVPAQAQTSLPLTDIRFTPPEVQFVRMTQVGTLAFEGHLTGDSITGRITQSGMEGTFALARTTATPASEPAAGATAIARPDLERTFLEPCSDAGVAGSVFCGLYSVPENRAGQSGRMIDLKVVVLPAVEPDPAAGPVVFLAGGPGGAATQLAPAIGVLFPDIKRSFDIVLVDQRGTGASNPLQCGFQDFDELARAMLLLDVDEERVVACRDSLPADLRLYATHIAMDDLDEVRAALGFERVNLYGMSYGTRAALVYARRHPESVRTMTLQGVAPTTRQLPVDLAANAQAALDIILKACADDPECVTRYGDLSAELDSVVERLARQPGEVAAGRPGSPWGGTVRITDGVLAGGLRLMMYTGQGAARVPSVISSAARGDYSPLVQAISPLLESLGSTLHFGMFLSVTCTEDLQGVSPDAVSAASQGTLLGDRMARNFERLCGVWPKGSVPRGYHLPVRSNVPTLLLSGSADPVTPADAARETAAYLSHSLELMVPNAGHADIVGACESRIIAAFIAQGTTEGLDTHCVAPRPRSFTPPARPGG